MTPGFSLFFSSFFETDPYDPYDPYWEKGTPFSPPVTPKQSIEMDRRRERRMWPQAICYPTLGYCCCVVSTLSSEDSSRWTLKQKRSIQLPSKESTSKKHHTLPPDTSLLDCHLIPSFSFLPFDHTPTFLLSVGYDDHLGLMTLMMMMMISAWWSRNGKEGW